MTSLPFTCILNFCCHSFVLLRPCLSFVLNKKGTHASSIPTQKQKTSNEKVYLHVFLHHLFFFKRNSRPRLALQNRKFFFFQILIQQRTEKCVSSKSRTKAIKKMIDPLRGRYNVNLTCYYEITLISLCWNVKLTVVDSLMWRHDPSPDN